MTHAFHHGHVLRLRTPTPTPCFRAPTAGVPILLRLSTKDHLRLTFHPLPLHTKPVFVRIQFRRIQAMKRPRSRLNRHLGNNCGVDNVTSSGTDSDEQRYATYETEPDDTPSPRKSFRADESHPALESVHLWLYLDNHPPFYIYSPSSSFVVNEALMHKISSGVYMITHRLDPASSPPGRHPCSSNSFFTNGRSSHVWGCEEVCHGCLWFILINLPRLLL